MGRLGDRFKELKSRDEKALVLFVTAGDPSLQDLPVLLETLQDAGADVLEVGIPFSDPIADGPTIQASDHRALENGVTPKAILQTLSKAKLKVPVVLMGYINPILRMGMAEFAKAARDSGACGVIVTDLIPEESAEWVAASRSAGLDNIFLAAPTSTDARLKAVCNASSGFVYAVSRTGVTGANSHVPSDVPELVKGIKSCTTLPVCVGFGISRPEHVKRVCEVADGAVIGSWLVDLLHKEWDSGRGRKRIEEQVKTLKAATLAR
jgi:tryptophan synthase alpha chain